jgi:hypothetical protein
MENITDLAFDGGKIVCSMLQPLHKLSKGKWNLVPLEYRLIMHFTHTHFFTTVFSITDRYSIFHKDNKITHLLHYE